MSMVTLTASLALENRPEMIFAVDQKLRETAIVFHTSLIESFRFGDEDGYEEDM